MLGLQITQTHTSYAIWMEKCLSSTPVKNFIKCAQKDSRTSSMCDQSLPKV